ncbi:AAA family ATPase [Halobaculum sp. MBLA0147]|uniref:AAA family ATPase n=1 Tax=Halobaculum sp. MBLA0147 TaxID=3079934 RepID=UPI0035243743
MVTIESLRVQNFRGVTGEHELETDGENVVIVGPNGSGKSSLLEAADYLITGTISDLRGEGMGVVPRDEVIPNVRSDGECVVEASLELDDGSTQEFRRSFEERDTDPPEDELPTSVEEAIDTAEQGQHLLTRDDLLDLILAQPQSRREAFVELLDLPDIDERRLALQRTRKKLDKRVENETTSRENVAERLREIAGVDTPHGDLLESAVLEAVNDLREEFGAEPIDEITPEGVRKGIKSPSELVSAEALQREPPRQALEEFASWIESVHENLPETIKNFRSKLSEFHRSEWGGVDAKQLELLELGESVVEPDDDVCPLCDRPWHEDTPLLEDIRDRRERLAHLQHLKESIEGRRDDLRSTLNEGRDLTEYLSRELEESVYPQVEAIQRLQEVIDETLSIFSNDALVRGDLTPEELPIVDDEPGEEILTKQIKEALRASKELQRRASEVDDLSETEAKYERLQSVADQWAEYQERRATVERLESLLEQVKIAESNFTDAWEEVVGDIYEDISSRVGTYYERIHGDEVGAATRFDVTDTGVKLKKEFYDEGEFPPQGIHSEGHLDTLGLCLHLALTDYLQQGNESIILMDDVVMSVDQDHRREIARLIAEEFAEEYQVIITTHDELWAQQLKSEGALDGGDQVWLQEWSLDAGVTESRYRIDVGDQWDEVEAAMSDDDIQRAAHELRYATERMLQQTCTSLGAHIEYKPGAEYTVSDFKDAVCRRLDTLTGKARDNLHSHDDDDRDDFEAAGELDDKYGKLLHDVGEKLDRVNRRVHWTPGKWLTLGSKEFEEVYETHKAAYDLLYCDECGSSIRYEEMGGYHELRCNCREHYDITWS